MACLAVLHFSTLIYKRHDFRKNIELTVCVLIFYTNFSEICLFIIISQRDVGINLRMSSCRFPVILVRFY